jgi:Domain of unknown function (DUF222)
MSTPDVEQLRAAIDALAQADVVGQAQRDDLVGLWWEMARLEAQFARRLAELDNSVEWSVDGSRSAAGWLIANVRSATGDAHHRVKVARQSAQMPIANTAWQEGAISSRHVDALTRVRHDAKADAEFAVFEPVLVDVARQGRPEDVANVGRQWLDALDASLDRDGANRRKAAEYDRRHLNFSRSIRGLGFIDGMFESEGAALADSALKHRIERTRTKNDLRSAGQLRADAMIDIFRHYLDHQSRGTNRPHLMMVVDPATYAGEAVGVCEMLSGHRLHPDTLRRIACDAFIQRIVLDADGVPLDMGRAERTFTPNQYRAIMLRDGGCRMPGCDAGPEDCEAHHALIHWDDGGPTDIANGLAVCRGSGHHRFIHEGGWTVTGDPNGEITFHDPNGNERGSSRPRTRPPPIPTRTGTEVTLAQARAHDLLRTRAA